jgi:hypothetical protein
MRHIAIEIPENTTFQNTAFVAMPFSRDLDFLYDMIGAAANNAGLFTRRSDKNPTHSDFTADITKYIRHSKVVVVVCTPASAPSPNVIYELGMAHGLGKATIILTDDAAALPHDLKVQNALPHPPSLPSTEEEWRKRDIFVSKLTDRMREWSERVKNGLTDSVYSDVHVMDLQLPGRSADLSDVFWVHILTILAFAKEVHHGFHGVMAIHLSEFREAIEAVFKQFASPGRPEKQDATWEEIRKAWKAWRNYALQYDTFRVGFINHLQERRRKVEAAYRSLPADIESLLISEGFFRTITDGLNEYSTLHAGIDVARAEDEFIFHLNRMENVERLATRARDMTVAITTLITMADTLINHLIEAIREKTRPGA